MKSRRDIFLSLIALILGLIIIFPMIYCVCGAFKTASEFGGPGLFPGSFTHFENFREALLRGNLLRYALNSFIVALGGTLIRMVFSILAAYVFAYEEFRGKNALFIFVLGTTMIPADVLISTNYLTVSKLQLLNTYFACMVTSFVSASQVFMLRQRFLTISPSIREAARIDGYGDLAFIRIILLPLCRPVLMTLFIQSFTNLWNTYLWPLIVTASSPDMRTIMVGITRLNSWEDANYQLVLAGVCISWIPSLILFALMRKNNRAETEDKAIVG